MRFTTFAFLGLGLLCLQMVAVSAIQVCACGLPSKQLILLDADNPHHSLYIDADEKWAVETETGTKITLYDLGTMTRHDMDMEKEAGCRTSRITDDISKYQCIDEDAVRISDGGSDEWEYLDINYEEGSFRSYYVTQVGNKCQPNYAEFETLETDLRRVTYRRYADADYYKKLYGKGVEFCKNH